MKLTTAELREYQRELEARVCSLCRASGYERSCVIDKNGDCPISLHLPRIVDAVLSTPRSPCVADYIPRIRAAVCSRCTGQNEWGVCAARDLASCGLDAFLLIVVSTIEEVHDRLASAPREPESEVCSSESGNCAETEALVGPAS